MAASLFETSVRSADAASSSVVALLHKASQYANHECFLSMSCTACHAATSLGSATASSPLLGLTPPPPCPCTLVGPQMLPESVRANVQERAWIPKVKGQRMQASLAQETDRLRPGEAPGEELPWLRQCCALKAPRHACK